MIAKGRRDGKAASLRLDAQEDRLTSGQCRTEYWL
jgi:hypothetical protein